MVSQNTWKYLSIGVVTVLAVSLFVPQASAHITKTTAHMLEHIYSFVDGIEAKTNNLPDDPADQSEIDAQLAEIQSDTDDIQTRIGSSSEAGASPRALNVYLSPIEVDPLAGDYFREILPYVPGKTYSGHITGHFIVGTDVRGEIGCVIGGEHDIVQISMLDSAEEKFSKDFACDEIRLSLMFGLGRETPAPSSLIATIHYYENDDLSELSS